MPDKEMARSIRFPVSLWRAIDADADLHRRSAVKHLEFLLTAYYRGEAPSLDLHRLANMKSGGMTPPSEEMTLDEFYRQLEMLKVDTIAFKDDLKKFTPDQLRDILETIRDSANDTLENKLKQYETHYSDQHASDP